jgi:hypothetical protein
MKIVGLLLLHTLGIALVATLNHGSIFANCEVLGRF